MGANPDLLKDESKDKFGRFKAGDHTLPSDYAAGFEWSVRLVRRLIQGEVVTDYVPAGLLSVKRERPAFNRLLSSGSASTTTIDLCSPVKKSKNGAGSTDKDPSELTADDVLLAVNDEVDRGVVEEALAGFLADLDVEDANARELEAIANHDSD